MNKRLVCTTKDGLKIYEVNGREVRDQFLEFALTCCDKRCKFVPENEVWVEKLADTTDMCFNLKRELTYRLVADLGVNAKKTNGIAAQLEKAERRRRECDINDVCRGGEFSSSSIRDHILEMLPVILEEEIQGG